MKTLGELMRIVNEADLENAPQTEWTCPECGTVNTVWVVSMEWIFMRSEQKYVPGACPVCEQREKEAAAKRVLVERWRNRQGSVFAPPHALSEVLYRDLKVVSGNKRAVDAVKTIETADRWIYLWGPNSTGKSYLLAAAFNELVLKGKSALYLNEVFYWARLRSSFDRDAEETEYKILKKFRKADYVLWDEFAYKDYTEGQQRITYQAEQIYFLLELLSGEGKRVVFASNLNPETLDGIPMMRIRERIGKRSVARLQRNKLHSIELKNQPFD